jgi:molybdenum cofactor synthesis domain-containing protein
VLWQRVAAAAIEEPRREGDGLTGMAGDGGKIVTAAVLAIGDELLSGRTADTNINYIARYMTTLGVDMREARIVPDIEEEIVAALNELRKKYDYVFTTGGIGPTHDDITADAIAKAFGVGVSHHPEAVRILKERYERQRGLTLNEARLRMARIPDGGELIDNPVSGAPGFRIGNVFVMAGVPAIMQAMLDTVAPLLETGAKMLSREVTLDRPEGDVAELLGDLQKRFTGLSVGSYPFFSEKFFGTKVVMRARDEALLDEAEAALNEGLEAMGGNG